MPLEQLDVDSIRQIKFKTAPSSHFGVIIRNIDGNTLNEIVIDGQTFVPSQVDANTQLVEFRSKYSYQYSAASEEYVKEVTLENEKHESDLVHCKKLLHELPIALRNSQIKLSEEAKAVRAKVSGMELADLGALVIEQLVIADEIKDQEERLPQLKPTKFDKSKFLSYHFQSQISLKFGWHKFGSKYYELIHTPMPTADEINGLLQSNQPRISLVMSESEQEGVSSNDCECISIDETVRALLPIP